MEDQVAHLLKEARLLLAQQELRQMLDLLQEALFANPALEEACALLHELKEASKLRGLLDRAQELRDSGRAVEARALAEKICELDNNNQDALLLLEQLSSREVALEATDQVSETEPDLRRISPDGDFQLSERRGQSPQAELDARADRLIDLCTVARAIREYCEKGDLPKARALLVSKRGSFPGEPLAVLKKELSQREKSAKRDQWLFKQAKNCFNKGDLVGARAALEKMSVKTPKAQELLRKVEAALQRREQTTKDKVRAAAAEIHQLLEKDRLEEAEERLRRSKRELGEDLEFERLAGDFDSAKQRRAEVERQKQELRKGVELIEGLIEKKKLERARMVLAELNKEFGKEHPTLVSLSECLRPLSCDGDLYYKKGHTVDGEPGKIELWFRNSSPHNIRLIKVQVLNFGRIDRLRSKRCDIRILRETEQRLYPPHTLGQKKEPRLIRWLGLGWLWQHEDPVVEAMVWLDNRERRTAKAYLLPSGKVKTSHG